MDMERQPLTIPPVFQKSATKNEDENTRLVNQMAVTQAPQSGKNYFKNNLAKVQTSPSEI